MRHYSQLWTFFENLNTNINPWSRSTNNVSSPSCFHQCHVFIHSPVVALLPDCVHLFCVDPHRFANSYNANHAQSLFSKSCSFRLLKKNFLLSLIPTDINNNFLTSLCFNILNSWNICLKYH